MNEIPKIVIAATQSGSGKTTIVTGILSALKNRHLKVQSYKIGPDYIDPGYHSLATGRPAHNLDTWLVPKSKIIDLFNKTAQDIDIAIISNIPRSVLYRNQDNNAYVCQEILTKGKMIYKKV